MANDNSTAISGIKTSVAESRDKELEKQITEAEANGEPAEVIQALIADSETEKQKLEKASAEEEQIETFKKRKEKEDAETERLDDMRFGNHGHITGEEIDEVNTSSQMGAVLFGYRTDLGDDSIIPKLKEVYGDSYDITNPSSWNESITFKSHATGEEETFDFSKYTMMHLPTNPDEMAKSLATDISAWIDGDKANTTPEMEAEWDAKQELSAKLSGAGVEDGLEIIDKNVEGWNDHDESFLQGGSSVNPFATGKSVEEVFEMSDGATGGFGTFWASGESGINTNNNAQGERLSSIIDDVNDVVDEVLISRYDDMGGTEFEIKDQEKLYEHIFEEFKKGGVDRDYLLPKDEFWKMMGMEDPDGGHLQAKIDEHAVMFEKLIGDDRLSNAVADEDFIQRVFDKDHMSELTPGETAKYHLIQKAEPLEKRKHTIKHYLKRGVDEKGNKLSPQAVSQFQQEQANIEKELGIVNAEMDANAVKYGSRWGEDEEELSARFYLNGQNEEGAYEDWKVQFEVEGYQEARDGADESIRQIANLHPGMTMREAEQKWFDDLMLENQILRKHGRDETLSVDMNAMDSKYRKRIITYLKATDPDFNIEDYAEANSGFGEFFTNDKAAYVDVPISMILDDKDSIMLASESGREGLGYSVEDFEGWHDKFFNWADDVGFGLSEEDTAKLSQYQHELYRNKGKRKAAFDKAYLDFDPASVDPASDVGSLFGEGLSSGHDPADFVGTVVNRKFWVNAGSKGLEAMGTQWFDQKPTDIEGSWYVSGSRGDRMKLDRIQSAASDFNAEYATEIEAGEMETLAFTEEQVEAFDESLAESVSNGVGEFVPTLIELAAITAATRGIGTSLGISSAFTRLTALTRLKYGRTFSKILHHGGHLALEEAKMKVAGFKPGSGAAFYAGGHLGNKFFKLSSIVNAATSKSVLPKVLQTSRAIKDVRHLARGADPLWQKSVSAGVVGAGSGELAAITELAWDDIIGEKDFGAGMKYLYGDYDTVSQRLLTNALVFGIAGNMNKKHINMNDFRITTNAKVKFRNKKNKQAKELIRKNSKTVQEYDKKIKEYEDKIEGIEDGMSFLDPTGKRDARKRTKALKELKKAEEKKLEKELEDVYQELSSGRINKGSMRESRRAYFEQWGNSKNVDAWKKDYMTNHKAEFIADFIKKSKVTGQRARKAAAKAWKKVEKSERKNLDVEFQKAKNKSRRALEVKESMGKNSPFGLSKFSELEKFYSNEEAEVTVNAMIAQMKLQAHLNPTKINEKRVEELMAEGKSEKEAENEAREWDPEFEAKYKEAIIDPIERLIRVMAGKNGGVYKDLKVEWLDDKEALEFGLSEGSQGRYIPETNTMVFKKRHWMESGDGGVGAHEFIHYALRQYFDAHGKQLQLKFKGRIEDAFKKEFGAEFDTFFTDKSGRIVDIRKEYEKTTEGTKDAESVKNEEFLSNLAEFMSSPDIYYTKVANTFMKRVNAEFRSLIEESSFGKGAKKGGKLAKWLAPSGAKETLKLIARLGNDHRRGFDISGKIKLLANIDLLEDSNWMDAERVGLEFSSTTDSLGLAQRQQKISAKLTEKATRKSELENKKRLTGPEKYELKNIAPEVKALHQELASVDAGLSKHRKTQDAISMFKNALEADKILYEKVKKPLIDAEIAELDKEKLGQEGYDAAVTKIEAKHRVNNPNKKIALDVILEEQGGYINKLRSRYKKIKGSDLTRERFNKLVDAEVMKLMETYKGEKNDSFAAYLEGIIAIRLGNILKGEKIDLDVSGRTSSIQELNSIREGGFDIGDKGKGAEDIIDNLNESPGGEALRTDSNLTKLVKAGTTGKLRSGTIPLGEKAIKDIEAKAKEQELSLDMNYKDVPDIAAPHIKKLVYPKVKSEKPYIDSKGKKHYDYGKDAQKRANFIANNQKSVDVSIRKNLALDSKGEGVGKATNVPKTLMNRKRPGKEAMENVYFRDKLDAEGNKVSVKKAKTGDYRDARKVKGSGQKTGTYIKERIDMTPEQFLAEAGIVDNRIPEHVEKAKKIASSEVLSPGMIKFMMDHGNVNVSAVQRKALNKEGKETPTAHDRGLPVVQEQLINELSQAVSVQAIAAVKMNSPEFRALSNAAGLISAATSGKGPLLESRGLSQNLADVFGVKEKKAQEYWEKWAYGQTEDLPKDVKEYLDNLFSGSDFKESVITLHRDAVTKLSQGEFVKSMTGWIKSQRLREGKDAIPSDILDQAEIASEAFMGDVVIEGKKYKWIDYNAISEHFEFAEKYLEQLPELSAVLLKNLPGDLLGGRRGTDAFAKALTEQFSLETKQGKNKKTYTEATRIISAWSKGKEVKPEFKEFLDKPENQHTGIMRRNKDGSHTEVLWTDPLLTQLAKAREGAGKKMHSVFEGVDFKDMKQASFLGTKYDKARELREEGRYDEAEAIITEAFTAVDGKAKKALYNGTGVVLESMIQDAKTPEARNKAIRFAFRMAKANTNLTEGERALTDNRFFYEGSPGSRKKLVERLMSELGMSREKAEERAIKAKVEHSLVSLVASMTKASMAAEGRWSKQGKDMAADYIGIFDVDGRLELIDNATGRTNPAALSRMSQLRRELTKYKEYVDGKFTGRNLEDVLVAEVMADIVKIDSRLTTRELTKPYLRDAVEKYKETNGGPAARKGLEIAIKNKSREIKGSKTADNSLESQINSLGLSRSEKLDLMSDISIATRNSRRRNAKRKGMSTWDFDDTLARTKSDVLFTAPDGTKGKLNATEFAKEGSKLLEDGYKFDFSEFNKVTEGKPGPFLEKALERARKFGTENTYILTARSQAAAPAIREFLKSQGLDIPLENITGLGDSTGAAKARWMVKKFAEGYNDMYFADDAMANVKAVKYVLDRLDTKSSVQQAKALDSLGLSQGFNKMIERKSGIGAEKVFSGAKGKMLGRRRWSRSLVVPGAQDFMGLMQNFIGKGEKGNADRAFFEQHLGKPFARAHKEMNDARQRASEDMKALYRDVPSVKKKLNKVIPGSAFTYDQAIRSYLWKKAGYEIPELSTRDLKDMVEAVENNADLKVFAEGLQKIGKGKWTKPTESWVAETIVSDLFRLNNKERRAEYLEEWQQNIDEIFSKENLNKIEATQGSKFREALEDGIYRMKTGSNRPTGANRLQNTWTNFINGSVGATMFLNMKSALFQTISATNYMNWNFNNPAAAARAFANQKQYWKDFSMLWNSPMLKQRRSGLEYNVQEAELAAALAGQTNKAKAAMAWLIKKGFTPTQIADSFAISSGGAAHYRNNVRRLMKQGKSKAEAEQQAFLEFQELTEVSQQSSRADLISQQQASGLGRTILAWANTPMQYLRIQEKAARDIINGRGSNKENLGKIAYYGAIQSIVFAGLQNALFAWGLDEDDDMDDKGLTKSLDRTVNTVIDGQLRGFGVGGAVVSALKNTILEFQKQEEKNMPDHKRTTLALLGVSPVLSSKIRKMFSAGDEWNYNRDAISEMGWDIDNPVIHAGANVIEATTNMPVARIVQKVDNLRNAADDNNQWWQRVASAVGFSGWSIGIEDTEVDEAKARGKKNRKNTKNDISDKKAEEGYIKDQEKERDRGQQKITCAGVTKNGGRCKTKPIGSGTYCTVHQKVATRKSGKKTQCSARKSNGKRCKMQTSNQSGKCYYHD